ncbi:endo-1,5-arabinanase [Massarina eburnea CBS 473.64]|uniref:Arabinan endo-1,5-alpha-L-arabinosidase n=1 Tax=Massarina eburnea CBS 473.64 TaxID=1395130 RepID=A0A6A6RLI8_9PLEO|nr:endo-1,5-arabinanase [Massarina eburnea CBS 473.64]
MRVSTLTTLLSAATAVHGYANPLTCSGVCTNAHDPALIRRSSDGKYYRFSTGGKIAMHSATTINGPWTYLGAAIPNGSKIDLTGNDDLWAPDVTLFGDTYYMFYSVSSFGSQSSAIGVATSTDLETWTDHGATGVASSSGSKYNAIDPAVYYDGSKMVMTFGSFWQDIFTVNMNNPPLTVASGASSTNIAYKSSGTHAQEGAYIAKNGDYHYLFFSVGQCCGYDSSKPASGGEYKIQVCRSTSATSGFVDKSGTACTAGGGTTVLESHGNVYGPGGQGVYYDPTLGPVLYYHYVDTTIGYADGQKQFGINTIDFSTGWPVV